MLELKDVCIRAGSFALTHVSLHLPPGDYAVLMGKTGCGKTTLIESICGLRRIDGGTIRLAGTDIVHLSPGERGIGYVPQDAALFRSMNVRQHLSFALQIRGWKEKDVVARVAELASLLHLETLLDRMPARLSGGESQRVALGRALSFRPNMLIMDEPLSALDDDTREQMYSLLRDVRETSGATVLHVSHSAADAENLATCVLKIEGGRILRSERPGRKTQEQPLTASGVPQ